MVYRREEAGKRTVQGHEPKLIYRETLDVEDQVGVGGDIWRSTLLAVCQIRGNGETTLAASSHANNTKVPSLDDLTNTKLERERLALLVGYTVC
jgi:hypothetical protein